MDVLSGFGGQVLLGGVGVVVVVLAAGLGRRLGVTPQQVREVLQVADEVKANLPSVEGFSVLKDGLPLAKDVFHLDEKDIAKEAQRRIRRNLKKVIGL